MKSFYWILASIYLCCQSLYAESLQFTGTAQDIETKEILYTETYSIKLDTTGKYMNGTVTYRKPEGDIFAKKTVDYQDNPLNPNFIFNDFRDNTQITVKRVDNQANIQIQSADTNQNTGLTLDTGQLNIIDAGFDRMVHQYWDKLMSGNIVGFQFLALPKSAFIPLRIKPTAQTDTYLDLKIQAKNLFIRMLLAPINLRYAKQTKQLIRYEGVTNLRSLADEDNSDDNFRAIIEYQY